MSMTVAKGLITPYLGQHSSEKMESQVALKAEQFEGSVKNCPDKTQGMQDMLWLSLKIATQHTRSRDFQQVFYDYTILFQSLCKNDFQEAIKNGFKSWALKKGFGVRTQKYPVEDDWYDALEDYSSWTTYEKDIDDRKYNGSWIIPSVLLAYSVADRYDAFIGVARDGLFVSYLFELFGAQVFIVRPNSYEESYDDGLGISYTSKKRRFSWLEVSESKLIRGAKVAVLDIDTCSGDTAKFVGDNLRTLSPGRLDLFNVLLRDYAKIPDNYDAFYPAEWLDYFHIPDALEMLKTKLNVKIV
ncbi:MAG: hypothetical protein ABIE74_12100 [Pseudomonadota bacterium]